MSFKHRHTQTIEHTNQLLTHALAHYPSLPCDLLPAMEYALLGQGKRVRPLFIAILGETLAIDASKLAPFLLSILDISFCLLEYKIFLIGLFYF